MREFKVLKANLDNQTYILNYTNYTNILLAYILLNNPN